MGVNHYLTHYASATQYARIYKERDRVITVKKTIYTYLKNIFDSRLYQFIAFTFLLKPLVYTCLIPSIFSFIFNLCHLCLHYKQVTLRVRQCNVSFRSRDNIFYGTNYKTGENLKFLTQVYNAKFRPKVFRCFRA